MYGQVLWETDTVQHYLCSGIFSERISTLLSRPVNNSERECYK